MTEKERIDTFLTAFKDLENYLLSIAKINEMNHVSFSKALNEVYYKRKDPAISEYENYDFLKTASDLRNILSHENNICAPSEEYLNEFISLKETIINPLTCSRIATKKIYTCKEEDSVLQIIDVMVKKSLSHLPILNEDGSVKGVFSRNVIFDILSLYKEFSFTASLKIKDIMNFLDIDAHLNEKYIFVSKDDKVNDVFSSLYKKNEHEKNVALLLVTKSGSRKEKLIGIISATDISKYVK